MVKHIPGSIPTARDSLTKEEDPHVNKLQPGGRWYLMSIQRSVCKDQADLFNWSEFKVTMRGVLVGEGLFR